MIPTWFVVWLVFAEAVLFLLIIDFQRPDKETRENIREFAEDYNVSERQARNWILKSFFKAYEHGLKEKLRLAHDKNNPTFEQWKAEQDRKFEEDLKKLQEHKQIVKPKKIHPEK